MSNIRTQRWIKKFLSVLRQKYFQMLEIIPQKEKTFLFLMQKIKHEKTIQTQEGNNRLKLINKLDEQCIVKIIHQILKGGTTRGRWFINFIWNFFSTLSLIMRTIGSKLISEQCRWKYSAWSAFEMSSWPDWWACWCIWCCQCWWCNTGLEKDKDGD